jgi:hypothetical protein
MVVTNVVKIVSISIPQGSRSYIYWSLQEYYKASLCVRTNTPFSFVIRSDHTFIGPYKNITKPQYVLELTPHSQL